MEGTNPITVRVGNGETAGSWTLPKDLLTHASPFFRAALNGPWPESESREVELREDYPVVFRFFVEWLYIWAFNNGRNPRLASEAGPFLGARAWILGDKLGCPWFQDFALVTLSRGLRTKPGELAPLTRMAYANTPPKSRLRRFLSGMILNCVTRSKAPFNEHNRLLSLIDEVAEVAKDFAKLQMLSPRPFEFNEMWASCFLVSSREQYDL